MVDLTAMRRSPLHHSADTLARTGSSSTVRLRELRFLTQIELRAERPSPVVKRLLGYDLPAAGEARGEGPRCALWCGPGWYLVVDEPGGEAALEESLRAALGDSHGSVVDVSAGRTVLELDGPSARDVLQHGCTIDLHRRAFSPGRCARTTLAKAQVLLHQTSPTPTYRIYVQASYADYLARWLLDAMVEYTTHV